MLSFPRNVVIAEHDFNELRRVTRRVKFYDDDMGP